MINKLNKKQGFTMLVAVIVTGMLLIISFAVVNIAVRQLILASSNEESQHAFYAADSGVECAVYWDFRNGVSAFSTTSVSQISCGTTLNQNVGGGGLGNATSTFQLNYATGCAIVQVGKHYISGNLVTIIDSRGYNTCNAGVIRKVERAEKLTY